MPDVVSCVLFRNGKILLLRRSEKVSTYKGFWGVIAGYVEEDEKPEETAYKEIREEVRIEKKDLRLLKRMKPVNVVDKYEGKRYSWRIHPFLFELKRDVDVRIDWEHVDYKWIKPKNIVKFKTVPCLKEIVLRFFDSEKWGGEGWGKCGGGEER